MITSSWKFGLNIDEITSIREASNDSWDSFDEKSIQLIIYNEGKPVGCGSIYFDDGNYHIAHLNVLPDMQKQHIGDLMMRLLLIKGFNMMAEKIILTPTPSTKEFFKKYGFEDIENSDTMEVSVRTLIMNSKCGHDCSQCVNKENCVSK